ncbi:MAG TPA: helix-hairpin-helix domain-containing protein [Syntrophales bacterium]|nr:helix-hairpin-helix domain-containing protein [Syntrophales bacterium]HQM27920.1 helix-hairpin-helix domain-containing protein [Syntrophales bacterium]
MITVALCFFRSTGIVIIPGPVDVRPPYSDETSGPVIVELAGRTGIRGVYFVPEGSSVLDFLIMTVAGKQPATVGTKLTDRLKSASLVTVGCADCGDGPDVNVGRMSAAKRFALGLPMDLNSVTSGDLELVPGIGEKTATRIIDYRRENGAFRKVSDLKNIKGIKEKKYASLRRHFSVD